MQNDVKKEKKNSREFQAHRNQRTTSPIVSFACMKHTRITYPVSIRILVSSFGKIWLSSSFFCVVCALLPKPPEWLFLQIPSRCSFSESYPISYAFHNIVFFSPSFSVFLRISAYFPTFSIIFLHSPPYHIISPPVLSFLLFFSIFHSFFHIFPHFFHTFFAFQRISSCVHLLCTHLHQSF